jgi:hypothetical protein
MEKPSENFLVFILIGDDKYKFFLVYLTDGKYFLIIFRNKVVSGCINYIFLLVYSFFKGKKPFIAKRVCNKVIGKLIFLNILFRSSFVQKHTEIRVYMVRLS